MKRVLPIVFAGIFMSLIGAGCGEREAQSQRGSETLQQEQQPMNQGQTGSEYQTQEQPPAEQQSNVQSHSYLGQDCRRNRRWKS